LPVSGPIIPPRAPVYGDLSGFPPTIHTSGTRDLFRSNTVRVDRMLRRAGIVTDRKGPTAVDRESIACETPLANPAHVAAEDAEDAED
jgi:hypothetical protein